MIADFVKIKYEAPRLKVPPARDVLKLFVGIGLPQNAILSPKAEAITANSGSLYEQCTGPRLADALIHKTTRQRSGVGATDVAGYARQMDDALHHEVRSDRLA